MSAMQMKVSNMQAPSRKVELNAVTKRFVDAKRGQQTVALEGVDMTMIDGEFVCLLGPSGCGKSTILNLLAGFETATEGGVSVEGRPVTGPGPDRGVIFQQAQLFPWLTVMDNVTFGPRMGGMDGVAARKVAQRYIDLVGLGGFEGHYPYELSGGMQQRAAIARAWISEPGMLLMDEPFGALDAQTRQMMQEELLAAWEAQRITVLFVTHDIDEALFLADRILVMSARPGRIVEDLAVPFQRPRRYEEIIFGDEYKRLKQHVMQAIRHSAPPS